MNISDLLAGVAVVKQEIAFSHITLDSREITNGGVFFAVAGATRHGLQFADQVQQQGAVAIVYDPAKQGALLAKDITGIALFAVERLSEQLGELAARFYGRPSEQLHVIGITGTNGKTSCSQFLAQAMADTGVIGTLGWGCYPSLQKTTNTTPDALLVQKILADFVARQQKNVVMEVSSHGLQQGRVNAVKFSGAIFNNLSRDHLDYHGSMEDYFQAKLRLMQWPGLKFAVVNLDDAYAERVLSSIPERVQVLTYSMQDRVHCAGQADIKVGNIEYTLEGIECDIFWQTEQARLKVALLGDFNLQNILAVVAVLLVMGKSLTACMQAIRPIRAVTGRMECFKGKSNQPLLVVDYAHTPDALAKVLNTLRQHCQGKLTVVFGCGGDRDKGKRAQMGAIAEQLADAVIVTNDNPRFEDSQAIIDQVIGGLSAEKCRIIKNRKKAITQAISAANKEDVVVVAGKGHEDYQEVQGVQYPFSDRQMVQAVLHL